MPQNIPATQGWVKLPNAILFDLSLTPLSVRVYAAIVHHTGGNASCWPSQTTLAERFGVSWGTIKREMDRLAKAGAITVEHRPGRVNKYSLTPISGARGNDGPLAPTIGHPLRPCKDTPSAHDPIENKNQEQEPLKEREESLGGTLDDLFGALPAYEAPFNIRWRPPDDLKQRQAEVVRVMEAWHQHIGPVRTLTTMAGANICHRLADWTADELVQAVVGYAKATSKWRGNGRKAKTPTKFFASDDDIQNYVVQGADNVPVDQLPKLMQILIGREFLNVHQHREVLTKINAQVDAGKRSGSAVMNAMNESNGSVDQFLDKLERATT